MDKKIRLHADDFVRFLMGMKNQIRSDARKHRQLLLDAALEIFAERGYGAPLDMISARAGVGQGTLYRNFANRIELLTALIDRDVEALEEALQDTPLAEQPMALIEALAEHSVMNPTMGEHWLALPRESEEYRSREIRFLALASRGIEEAKAAGYLRQDITTKDICFVGLTFRAVRMGATEADRRLVKQRLLGILTQGLHP